MANNKVTFDVLANTAQYKKQMGSLETTTTQTSNVIKASFAIATASIGGALKAYGSFETALVKVGKTADISGKELDDFGKKVIALSSKIPLSTNELLELSASAAQLGVKGEANILKFTETVAKLGTATNIVGEEGSQAIARLLNVTGEGIETVDKFGAIIVRLGNNVAATESEILSMASRVGKSTAQFELGTTAVLGISAALKEVGVEAELGGSAIGRTFAEIQKAVFGGGKSLETFSEITGKTGAELKEIFEKDATQAFTLFITSLNKLPAEQVAIAMENMGLGGVRLTEVIGTLAKRSDILTNSLALAGDEAQKQTALNEEFERAVGSLENSFKFMKNEVVNLASSMGKDLAPAAKKLFEEIGLIIKGIREFNEATGGTVTTSIVMAAKISALVIAFNKLKTVLIATGIISATMSKSLAGATIQTTALGTASALTSAKNAAMALSFNSVRTAAISAGIAIKGFQVSLGAMVAGLLIAIEAGNALGKVLGKINELTNSEKELADNIDDVNKLFEKRAKLQNQLEKGNFGAQKRIEEINQEISRKKALIDVIQKEVDTRAGRSNGQVQEEIQATPTLAQNEIDTGGVGDNSQFLAKEDEKTQKLEDEVNLRIAAAQREAEALAAIQSGASEEMIKNLEDRNSQLSAIEASKAELDRINQDLSRQNINANEQAILEAKRNAITQELAIMEEKFSLTQEKTSEQEAIDMERRIAGKEILNQALTEQEILFLEEKRARDEENRAIDLEVKQIQDEEDLFYLQNKLITEQQAKDLFRQQELNRQIEARNRFLKDEAQFGKAYANLNKMINDDRVKGASNAINQLVQLQNSGNSQMKAIGKAAALVQVGIDTARGAVSAYSSLAPIPIIGPALGAAAAATLVAYGATQAGKIQGFAVGTDYVPNDMMAQIHAGEAIVPAKQNQFLQSGDLILGSPDAINNNSAVENVINLNFEGANFIGNIGNDDEVINQIFEGIASGINEGRLAGFENTKLSVLNS